LSQDTDAAGRQVDILLQQYTGRVLPLADPPGSPPLPTGKKHNKSHLYGVILVTVLFFCFNLRFSEVCNNYAV
jgi:hypothetical protein